MRKLLESLFNVEPEESRVAILLFLHCMCVVAAAFVIGRSVGNTLFLQRVDTAYLPYTYVVAAFAVSCASLVYVRFAGRVRTDRLIAIVATLSAAVVLATRILLEIAPDSLLLLGFVYVLFDVIGDISIIQVWTLAGDLFTARQAKRLFAVVGAGGSIAGMVFGGLLSVSVKVLGTANLLVVSAFLLLGVVFIARQIGKSHGHQLEICKSSVYTKRAASTARSGLAGDFSRVLKSPYLLAIAALIAVTTVVSVLVDYQWKLTANAAFAGDEIGLAAYFGLFCLVTNGLALVVQVFVASRLLERYGIRAGLSMLPALLMLAMAGLMLAPAGAAMLWAASAAKGGDGTLRYSIHNASMEMLYRPIGSFRPRAKAIIDGIAKPVWAAFGGLIIAALATVAAPRQLGVLTVSLLLAWFVLVGIVRRHYIASLATTLRSRRALNADSAVLDRTTIVALEQALSSSDARQAANAMTLLESFPAARWQPPLDKLLQSTDPNLRRRAVEYVARHGGNAVEQLEALIDDDNPELSGAALAALIAHGDATRSSRAARRLQAMCRADDARTRVAAAKALGLSGNAHLPELIVLTGDASVHVRIQAAKSALHFAKHSHELTDRLVELLEDPRTRRAAADALITTGPSLIERLEPLLEPLVPRRTQVAVISILERIPHGSAIDRLARAMQHERERTRHAAVVARCRIARKQRTLADGTSFEIRLEAEVREYFQRHVTICELGEIEPLLLGEALTLRQLRSAERALQLVSALHQDTEFHLVSAALRSPKNWLRANAVELLDNTMTGPNRGAVLALFDDGSTERRLARAAELFPNAIEHQSRDGWLATLTQDEDPWLATCAIYEVARNGGAAEGLATLCEHPQSLIRQTARAAARGELGAPKFIS